MKRVDSYIEEGYDRDQLDGIRFALELGVDIEPYLNLQYRGACIKEIALGLKKGLDVSAYADLRYSWRKMREIRLGLEQGLDVSGYQDPLYSYWQMREIRLGLKTNLDVSYYDSFMYTANEMRKRRLILKNRKNAPGTSGNWTVFSEENYDLCVSPDGMKAYIYWHCKCAVKSAEELEDILKQNGIVFGVDHKALEKMAQEYQTVTMNTESDSSILVARGNKPRDGKNGRYEWKFRVGRKRKMNLKEDGSIDFDSMQWFDYVQKGQVLAVYHFAEPSSDGMNVFGKKIPAQIGREKDRLKGKGFELLSDFRTYVASVDGHVSLKNGELMVKGMLVLDGLDSSSQPVDYAGDVYIRGNIEGPVILRVGGDLVVDGFAQSAAIHCGGDLILKGGINNASESLQVCVGGCVMSRFFEYVTLHAVGNIFFGTSLQSNLFTYGEVVSYGKKGGIIGGNSYSEKGYCLTNLGNNAGVVTTLGLGSNADIMNHRLKIEGEAKEIKTTLVQLVNARDQVSCRSIVKKEKTDEILFRIEQIITEKNRELMDVNQKMEDMKRRNERACESRIVVEHQIFDNVQIRYQNQKIEVVPSSQVEIKIDEDGIVMRKL